MNYTLKYVPPEGYRELGPRENIKQGDRVYYNGMWRSAKSRQAIGRRVALRKDSPWIREIIPKRKARK